MNTNFCPECGQAIEDRASFCTSCGARLSQPSASAGSVPGFPAPGFSSRVNDPEILASIEKTNKRSGKMLLLFLPAPILILAIYSLFSDEMELGQGLLIGAAISFATLVVNLIVRIKRRASNSYEAVVVDKKYSWDTDDNGCSRDEFITIVRMANGRKKKIVESSKGPMSAYEYLWIGDRFRYHPQFQFPYEKYDKTKDGHVYCVCCAADNDLRNDRCCNCGVPLLK